MQTEHPNEPINQQRPDCYSTETVERLHKNVLTADEAIAQLRDLPFDLPLDDTNSRVDLKDQLSERLGPELSHAIKHHTGEITRWILFRRAAKYLQNNLNQEGEQLSKNLDPAKVLSRFIDHIADPQHISSWYGKQTQDFKQLLTSALRTSLRPRNDTPTPTPQTPSTNDSSADSDVSTPTGTHISRPAPDQPTLL